MVKNTNAKNILVVDDTETNIDVLLELLDNDYEILVATDGITALEILQEEEIDLILLDIMMPVMDGFDVCQKIRQNPKTQDTPIIFITAKSDESSIEKAYTSGGNDYVTKPFKAVELLARIQTQLKLRELIDNLEQLASFDAMTGIYNRRKFFELAVEIFNTSKENLFAVMIDIDNFKRINDTYGHPTGDKVIKILAKSISENLCENSIFGRVGGEEFAILCHQETREIVEQKIEQLRQNVEDLEVLSNDNDVIKFTISEGITQADTDTKNIDMLLKNADEALYKAKGSGRNKVIFR